MKPHYLSSLIHITCLILGLLSGKHSSHLSAQCCTYTLSMHDLYGDGWNGGYLDIFRNDTLLGQFWGSGFGSYSTFTVCDGDQVRFHYTPGMYENENIYELYSPGWHLVAEGGPDPATGDVFTLTGDCSSLAMPGSHPCLAFPVDTTTCLVGDNSTMPGSGMSPFCAEFMGKDMWYVYTIPPSGNVTIETDSGSINDTGLAVWTDGCEGARLLTCDDDAGTDAFSFVRLYDLPAGQNLYIQVFGYGGAAGNFRLCVKDLGFVSLTESELPVISIKTLGQPIMPDNKVDALMQIRYNGPQSTTYLTDPPNVYNGHIGIEIRGATSSGYPQRPYSLETRDDFGQNLDVSLLGMPEESDYVLLSNYNDRSLLRNLLAFQLAGDMGEYAPRMQWCEVLVDSLYKGIYLFGEKIKRDKNRVDIAKINPEDIQGDPVSGGYILQQNYWDAGNSFLSNYSPIDHPGFDVHFVYEYPKPEDINVFQKQYIAGYIDSLETALYRDDFADPDHGYRRYLDVQSFIHYFLVNELARNNDGFKKSVYFYKDRYSRGGKLKAGPIWDFDWAWKNIWGCFTSDQIDGSQWAHHVNDCPTDNYGHGWYIRFLQDTTFTEELKCTYEAYRQTIFDTAYIFHYLDSMSALIPNATSRHFQKWPLLGVSGPAPEVLPVAQTYAAEIDTLKHWIRVRLAWLDANMPGWCDMATAVSDAQKDKQAFQYFPNPNEGVVHFQSRGPLHTPGILTLYNALGRPVLERMLESSERELDVSLPHPGVFYFLMKSEGKPVQQGILFRSE